MNKQQEFERDATVILAIICAFIVGVGSYGAFFAKIDSIGYLIDQGRKHYGQQPAWDIHCVEQPQRLCVVEPSTWRVEP